MHEFGLVTELIVLAEKELEAADVSAQVTSMNLLVGKFSGASPEALQTAFDFLSKDTKLLKYSRLNIIQPKPICQCSACQSETEIDDYVFQCPSCSSPDIVISGGDDLRLESIDVDE